MLTFNQLLVKAIEIRDEIIASANTATRVGAFLVAILRSTVSGFDAGSTYETGQYVVFSGQLWRCKAATSVGESPTNAPAKWEVKVPTLQQVTQAGNITTVGIRTAYYESPEFEEISSSDYVLVPKLLGSSGQVQRIAKISINNLGLTGGSTGPLVPGTPRLVGCLLINIGASSSQTITVNSPYNGMPVPHNMQSTAIWAVAQDNPNIQVNVVDGDVEHVYLTVPDGLQLPSFTFKLERKNVTT